MENLYFGIITIFICIIGYSVAFKQYTANNTKTALLLILICGLLLRLYTGCDFYLHAWDERYHALVAKNLINNPLHPMLYKTPVLAYDIKNWAGNHIWVHKQPFPLWTMAFSMSIFGVNEIALRLPSMVLTTLGIGITFYIAQYLFNKKVGIISAFLYSIHGLIIEIAAGRVATDHIDVFFLFFIQLAILLAIKYVQYKNRVYNVLCGISIGLAILSKWLPALIVLPIWFLLVIDSGKFNGKELWINFLVLISVTCLIALPWQWYIFKTFPMEAQWESSFNFKHITEALENNGQPFYYHFDKARMVHGELIYIPLVWFFYKTLKNIKNYRRLILTLWILIPFIFFSAVKTKMQAYTLFTAPALFIVTALFWEYLYQFRIRFKYKSVVYSLLFLLIALPVRYSIERIKPFLIRDRNPASIQILRELKNGPLNNDRTVVFNMEYPVETMFYTHCIAYSGIPDSLTLSNIVEKGYEVYIRHEWDGEEQSIQNGMNVALKEYKTQFVKWP